MCYYVKCKTIAKTLVNNVIEITWKFDHIVLKLGDWRVGKGFNVELNNNELDTLPLVGYNLADFDQKYLFFKSPIVYVYVHYCIYIFLMFSRIVILRFNNYIYIQNNFHQ